MSERFGGKKKGKEGFELGSSFISLLHNRTSPGRDPPIPIASATADMPRDEPLRQYERITHEIGGFNLFEIIPLNRHQPTIAQLN